MRYILKANNNDLVRILALGNVEATAEQIAVWLRKKTKRVFSVVRTLFCRHSSTA
ncbi:DUF1456 family protein [Escherichia coli]